MKKEKVAKKNKEDLSSSLTRQAALNQLSKLVELEVIKLEGKGRGAHYVIV